MEDAEQDDTTDVTRPESAPPPLSPQVSKVSSWITTPILMFISNPQALLTLPPLDPPPSSAAAPHLPPSATESNSRSTLADGKLPLHSFAPEISSPSNLSHEPSELRVKKSDKPAKFFKSSKKEKIASAAVPEEDVTKVEVPPHQMNGKHSEKEEEEELDDDSVPSSAKKRKRGDKKMKSKAVVDTESDASGSETEQSGKSGETKVETPGSKNNALDNIPNDFRFDPKNLANKPKGLVDALSSFFTPGLKRTSRTAMNSLLKPETVSKESPLAASPAAADSALTKVDEAKKVRLSVDEKETASKKDVNEERKRHASAGQQQVKSLYDGLSHLYADCDSRLRSAPNSEKAAGGKAEEKEDEEEEEEKGEGEKENKGTLSPSRLTDGESKEKEDPKKEGDKEKPDEGDKTKGSSKMILGRGVHAVSKGPFWWSLVLHFLCMAFPLSHPF